MLFRQHNEGSRSPDHPKAYRSGIRKGRARSPIVEPLEGRTLLASIQFLNGGATLSDTLDTPANPGSTSGTAQISINDLNTTSNEQVLGSPSSAPLSLARIGVNSSTDFVSPFFHTLMIFYGNYSPNDEYPTMPSSATASLTGGTAQIVAGPGEQIGDPVQVQVGAYVTDENGPSAEHPSGGSFSGTFTLQGQQGQSFSFSAGLGQLNDQTTSKSATLMFNIGDTINISFDGTGSSPGTTADLAVEFDVDIQVLTVQAQADADIEVNGTSNTSDDITLLDPGVFEQPIPVLVTNTGTGTSTFQIQVTPDSAGTVDQTTVTLAPNGSATLTFVPQAVSKSANDVSINAFVDGQIVGSGSLTVVSVTLPQDIRNTDTPAGMPDRIPPTAITPIDVQVTPDLSGSGQSITLAANNQNANIGTVSIDGGDTLELTSSATVELSGLTQTAPATDGSFSAPNAGKLNLVVQVRGQDTVLSNGFSVAAIMTGMTATFDMAVTRGKTRGVDVEYSYFSDNGSEAVSDSGPEAELSALKIKEIVPSTKSGVFKKKKAQPVYNLEYVNPFPPGGLIDQHEIDKALISSPGGLLTSSQAFVFEDTRTGATAVPVTNSGFITTQRVFRAIVRTARRRSVKRFELQTIIAGSATDPDGVSVIAGTTMDQGVPQAISRILPD
jgi:hypothetical protein